MEKHEEKTESSLGLRPKPLSQYPCLWKRPKNTVRSWDQSSHCETLVQNLKATPSLLSISQNSWHLRATSMPHLFSSCPAYSTVLPPSFELHLCFKSLKLCLCGTGGEQRPCERQQQPRPSVCDACGSRMVWSSSQMEKSVFRKACVIAEEKTTKIPSAGFPPFSDCNSFFFFKVSLQKRPRTSPQHRHPNAKLLYLLFLHTGSYREPVWTESHARGCGRWVGKQGSSSCSGHSLRTLVLGKIIFSQSDKMPAACLWLITCMCTATPPCYLVLGSPNLIVIMTWGPFIWWLEGPLSRP